MNTPIPDFKCTECGSKDLSQEKEDWDMTDGQMADQMAGTSGTLLCNKCGHLMPFDV